MMIAATSAAPREKRRLHGEDIHGGKPPKKTGPVSGPGFWFNSGWRLGEPTGWTARPGGTAVIR